MFIHCISGFYFGWSMTCMNNLGKPILKRGMGYTDSGEIASWLGNINLAYGIGKMFGSLLAGAIQKRTGKLNLLYLAEPFNIISFS